MPPNEAKPHSIFIFDDVPSRNQEIIKEYFSAGRHYQVESFFLSQTYASIIKHLLRDNANCLILFKQDDLNLKHIYQDHVGTDMTFEQFKSICSICWKDPYDFLSIFKDFKMNDGRYRKGFDEFFHINN